MICLANILMEEFQELRTRKTPPSRRTEKNTSQAHQASRVVHIRMHGIYQDIDGSAQQSLELTIDLEIVVHPSGSVQYSNSEQ